MAQEKWNEETDCQAPPEGQIFCTNNCGYFGSPATMDMCSKCYGDLVLLQPKVPITSVVEVTAIHSSVTELPLARTSRTERLVDAEIVLASAQILKIQKSSSELAGCSQEKHSNPNSSRCFSCNKRVGLTGFKCRCGDVFCARHRYSDEHNCTFDYKTAGRDAIAKENPLVKADKIRKI